jgi:hypothetical protein
MLTGKPELRISHLTRAVASGGPGEASPTITSHRSDCLKRAGQPAKGDRKKDRSGHDITVPPAEKNPFRFPTLWYPIRCLSLSCDVGQTNQQQQVKLDRPTGSSGRHLVSQIGRLRSLGQLNSTQLKSGQIRSQISSSHATA